jgi:hypothetical protein
MTVLTIVVFSQQVPQTVILEEATTLARSLCSNYAELDILTMRSKKQRVHVSGLPAFS